jgi:uncharacterized membrane protein
MSHISALGQIVFKALIRAYEILAVPFSEVRDHARRPGQIHAAVVIVVVAVGVAIRSVLIRIRELTVLAVGASNGR